MPKTEVSRVYFQGRFNGIFIWKKTKSVKATIQKRAKNIKIFQQGNIFNKYSTIKHKYDVSLSLQLIHVYPLKTTKMIKNIIYVQIRY